MYCVETFAGAGGAARGLLDAGLDGIHVEWDPDACATLRAAGFAHVVEGDVRACLPEVRRHMRAFGGEAPFLLHGSPPCQPFSKAGKRLGTADERNMWPAHLALIQALRPRWCSVENVLGVPTDDWIADLRAAGYAHVSGAVLDAADYGVPQHRRRVFLVAGPVPFDFPQPTHSDPARPRLGTRPWVSMADALPEMCGSYVRAEQGGAVGRTTANPSPSLTGASPPYLHAANPGRVPHQRVRQALGHNMKHPELFANPDAPSPTVRSGGEGHSAPYIFIAERAFIGGGRHPAKGEPKGRKRILNDEPSTTITSTHDHINPSVVEERIRNGTLREGIRDPETGEVFYPRGLGRSGTRPDLGAKPSPTVTTQESKGTRASASSEYTFNGGPDRASDAAFLVCGRRRLTPAEVARLQDFPDGWPFQGTKTAQYRQIGNAVPPTMARVVAEAILRADRRAR